MANAEELLVRKWVSNRIVEVRDGRGRYLLGPIAHFFGIEVLEC